MNGLDLKLLNSRPLSLQVDLQSQGVSGAILGVSGCEDHDKKRRCLQAGR